MLSGDRERAIGFKLPMNSIRAHPEVAEIVRADDGLRAVRLSRRNRLAQLVSRRLLAETQIPHSIWGDYGDATVRIDARRCLNALARMEVDERELDALAEGKPTFRLAYEDMIAGLGLDELQRFLGVEPRPLSSWFEKMRVRPLSASVSNWDELESALTGTPYEAFLADGP
jgi:hypothetical protein